MAEKIIEVKDLAISFKTQYGILQAVRGVSFDLYKGETLAIVGESGSGKSVTSRAIMGLLAGNAIYEGGSIMYAGRNLMHIDDDLFNEVRGSKISMIFQDPMSSLNPIMTVGKQITEALILKSKMPKEVAKNKAIELMKSVGIPDAEKRYNRYPFQFSGGMRQRLKEKKKLTVIFITHDLGVVANVADRIAVMYAGRIVETGTTEEVFYNSKHPYTWALLSSMPNLATSKVLDAISGTPPNMVYPPKGDAFAPRNKYAMKIDFEEQPPMFKLSETHYAATWLLHPDAPKVTPPKAVLNLMEKGGNKYEK